MNSQEKEQRWRAGTSSSTLLVSQALDSSTNLAAQKSSEEFRSAINKSSIVSTTDKNGTITNVNDNFIAISGYSEHELIGQNHRVINSGHHPKSFWIDMWKTISSGKVWRADVKNRAKDGSYYWVDTFVMPFLDEQGRVREFLSIRNDITLVKSQEENITELNCALNNFQDAIQFSSIVSRADKGGIITQVNDNFVKISGYSADELMGQNHRIINSGYHSPIFWKGLWRTIVMGKIWRGEIKNRAKDGSHYWVDTCIIPLHDSKGNVIEFLSIRNDLTNQKLQEERIIELKNDQLAKVNHQMEKFLYSTSHDLRSPITSILGLINLAKMERLDQAAMGYIEKIEASTLKLDKIIRDIMSFSRASYQRATSEKTDFDLLLWKAINAFKGDSLSRKIYFEVKCTGAFPFYCDVERLEIIFENIVRNAIQFHDVNKSRPFLKINVTVGSENAHLEFIDNGIGIGKPYLPEIFTMFYKASHHSKGAGLGLFIVKETLEKLHGTITVESEIGFGTVFRVVIPNDHKGKLINRKLHLKQT